MLGVGSFQRREVDCLGIVLCYSLEVGQDSATPVDSVLARFALGLRACGLAAMLQ